MTVCVGGVCVCVCVSVCLHLHCILIYGVCTLTLHSCILNVLERVCVFLSITSLCLCVARSGGDGGAESTVCFCVCVCVCVCVCGERNGETVLITTQPPAGLLEFRKTF